MNESDKVETRTINKTCDKMLSLVRTKLGFVSQHYYQTQWMAIGIALFGSSFGVVLFAITQNPAFIAIMIPLGIPIGMAIGANKDKEADKAGKQLKVD